MAFFKSHYEKIILAVLLLLFAGTLLGLVVFFKTVQKKKVDEIVNKKDPAPDYKYANYNTSPRYSADTVFSAVFAWNDRAVTPGASDKNKADLMTPPPLALCPYCFNLIPSDCFPRKGSKTAGKCSSCGRDLKPRTSNIDVVTAIPVNKDANTNGIPDEWEEKYGLLEKNDPDPDADGFTNADEFSAKTDPNDPLSHPLYITRLTLAGQPEFETLEQMLPASVKKQFGGTIRLVRIRMDADRPKETWEVEFLFSDRTTRPHRVYRYRGHIGGEVCYRRKNSTDGQSIPTIGYVISDITGGVEASKSEVLLKNKKDGTILCCRIKEPIRSPEATLAFSYPLLKGTTLRGTTGGTLVLGNEKTGMEKYQITNTIASSGTPSVTVTLTSADGKTAHVIRLAAEASPAAAEEEQESSAPPAAPAPAEKRSQGTQKEWEASHFLRCPQRCFADAGNLER